jgi:alanine dehydrogenase
VDISRPKERRPFEFRVGLSPSDVETSRATTYEHPVYTEEGILHDCVPNIPGAVKRAATCAFVNVAMPYITEVAAGRTKAIQGNRSIEAAVHTHNGECRHFARLTGGKE